jgi:quercetin dioxygenase-like cupin family protein
VGEGDDPAPCRGRQPARRDFPIAHLTDTAVMAFTIFRPAEVEWIPREDGSGRTIAALSDALTKSRANVWRYPPGARGKRHADRLQEEVFVVLDGTLTVDLGEPPERHEVERGGVLVVQPGTILQLRNAGEDELVLFIYGAPPETGGADFFEDVP